MKVNLLHWFPVEQQTGTFGWQKGVLLSHFDSFSPPNGIIWQLKAFLMVSLVSLSLRLRQCFRIFEKLKAIWLYWFAAGQQSGTFRCQKFELFFLEFSRELNELGFNI